MKIFKNWLYKNYVERDLYIEATDELRLYQKYNKDAGDLLGELLRETKNTKLKDKLDKILISMGYVIICKPPRFKPRA